MFDAAFLCGAGLIIYGIWEVYPPAAMIVGGAALIGVAYLGAVRFG